MELLLASELALGAAELGTKAVNDGLLRHVAVEHGEHVAGLHFVPLCDAQRSDHDSDTRRAGNADHAISGLDSPERGDGDRCCTRLGWLAIRRSLLVPAVSETERQERAELPHGKDQTGRQQDRQDCAHGSFLLGFGHGSAPSYTRATRETRTNPDFGVTTCVMKRRDAR